MCCVRNTNKKEVAKTTSFLFLVGVTRDSPIRGNVASATKGLPSPAKGSNLGSNVLHSQHKQKGSGKTTSFLFLVGVTRFEPATSASRTQRSTN